MVDVMQSEGSHSMWFTFKVIYSGFLFYLKMKMDDVSKESKTVRKFQNWPIFMFIYFNTSTFQREKATTEKVPSGSLLSRAEAFLGPSRGGPVSSQEWRSLVHTSLGHSRQALGLTSRVFGKEQPSRSSPRDLERRSYQAREGVRIFKEEVSLGLPSESMVKHLPCNVRDTGSISGSGRSTGQVATEPVYHKRKIHIGPACRNWDLTQPSKEERF